MRVLAIVLIGGLVACESHETRPFDYLDHIADHSPRVSCSNAPNSLTGLRIAELKSIGHDSLLVVLPDERQLSLVDAELQPLWTTTFEKEGPRGVTIPISAAFLDRVVYVVDQQKPKLRRFSADGTPLPDIVLKFLPSQVFAFGDRLAIIPAVMGRHPESLLYFYRKGEITAQPIAPREYPNLSVKMLGNTLVAAVLDSTLLLAHQFLTPAAYLIAADGTIRSPTVMIPREFASSVGYVPALPLDDESLKRVLTIALAAVADPTQRRFLLLARSGRALGAGFEKAIFQMDSSFAFKRAWILPINAGLFALLNRSNEAVIVDEDFEWYRCPLT